MAVDLHDPSDRQDVATRFHIPLQAFEEHYRGAAAELGLNALLAISDADILRVVHGIRKRLTASPSESSLATVWREAREDAQRRCKSESPLARMLRYQLFKDRRPRFKNRLEEARPWWHEIAPPSAHALLDRPGTDTNCPEWDRLLEGTAVTVLDFLEDGRVAERVEEVSPRAREVASAAGELAAAAGVSPAQALAFLLTGDVGGAAPPVSVNLTWSDNTVPRMNLSYEPKRVAQKVVSQVERAVRHRVFGTLRPRPARRHPRPLKPPPLGLVEDFPAEEDFGRAPCAGPSGFPALHAVQALLATVGPSPVYSRQTSVEVDVAAILSDLP
ncbi:MAG: hypothetical protein V3V35_05005 [Dehalococcoidia bacterium]